MQCIIHFFQERDWIEFRLLELDALLQLNGVDVTTAYNKSDYNIDNPSLRVILPNEEVAISICKRSILIKHICELWGEGATVEECIEFVKTRKSEGFFDHYTCDQSWGYHFDSFRRTLSMEEKQSYVAALSFLNLPGRVNLKKPDVPIWMCFNFIGPESSPAHISDEAVESTLLDTYIGRLLAVGGMREELKKYDLKRRFYLGPTSLDHALALLMANAAQVQRGGVVLDPFVGTASILVGASHFGGFCNGFDIDMRVLKGNMHAGIRTGAVNKHAEESNPNDGEGGGHSIPEGGRGTGGKGQRREKKKQKTIDMQRSIWENFRRYNLPLPEIIRMDNHLFDRHFNQVVVENMFDAIITDPPYGIRAGAKKSGRKGEHIEIPPERRDDLIPCTQEYPVEEVMLDLLHVAAAGLKLGGYLVYLIPTPYDFAVTDLPVHPCLELGEVCLQGLTIRHGRHLVVMKKVRALGEAQREEYRAYCTRVIAGEDKDFGMLIGKLQMALAADGYENEKVIKVSSKACEKRKQRRMKRIELRKQREECEPSSGDQLSRMGEDDEVDTQGIV